MTTRTFAPRHLFAAAAVVALLAPQVVQAQAQSYDLDIPAQNLDAALKTLASATGQQVAFRGETVRGKRSAAVKGRMTIEQAFVTMLAGSGLAVKSVSGNAFVIGLASPKAGTVGNDGITDAGSSDIVVTGTHLRAADPTSPLLTIARKDIDRSGYATAADLIKNMPQSSPGGQNFTVRGAPNVDAGNNSGYISSANLRGAGSDATLTLVNGRRLAYGGILNGVDVSTIPFGAIDRVEVLTDGASAIYGSDAVAGVVNFVLRKSFDGALTTLRSGTSTGGGGSEYQAAQLVGQSWSGGSAIASYEYYHQDPLYATSREFSRGAPSPNTLLPTQNRHSGFVTVRQEVGSKLSFNMTGLYTNRTTVNEQATTSAKNHSRAHVEQYGISPSVDIDIGKWQANLAIDHAQDDERTAFTAVRTNGSVSPSIVNFKNMLTIYEVSANGPLLSLPGGDVKLAVGGGYREEELQGYYVTSATSGSRAIVFGYGEIRVPLVSKANARPLLEMLELSASGRYESYSDAGDRFSPKAGVAYRPFPDFTLRGTWGKSFKAPTLYQLNGIRQASVYTARLFGVSTPANAIVVAASGANRTLRPEIATSYTAGFDYRPATIKGLSLSSTYFHINYTNRIALPFSNAVAAYNNPIYAAFINKAPSLAAYNNVINNSDNIANTVGVYDPSQVISVIDIRSRNLFRQRIKGIDLTASYDFDVGTTQVDVFANASFLNIVQQNLPTLPAIRLTGTIFNPAKFRARAGVQVRSAAIGATIVANHIGPELDNSGLTNPSSPSTNAPVSAQTTIDTQLTFGSTDRQGPLRGFQLALAVQNILDTKPALIGAKSTSANYPGLSYDSVNYSPVGRYISVTVSKRW